MFRRFDDGLKQAPAARQTKFMKTLVRGGLAVLSNGDVAAAYSGGGRQVMVQIVRP
ncbi:hypothetical protein [Chenggangzhangella methanolivorans]|uniref:Uncharacterized protein n=1 Tax=Chenggangzhangella methanolivorans TaxID=1437009 RepID=A0A9E6UQJ0_9HYPH|nr:hypothetical protein [Chenggangzhangella methanolivorans]QZO01010.1 hypothetical protein K6K41_05220 [Chenggangzhangella methanolivorans]